MLNFPVFGKGRFVLDTDASDFAMGAVLSQVMDKVEKVVAYGSKVFNPAERSYCTTRKELLAVVTFTEKFKCYLQGQKFLIRTDHQALKYLNNFKEPTGQLARWLEELQDFDYIIEHRPGKQHVNADALSRLCPSSNSCPTCVVSVVRTRAQTRQQQVQQQDEVPSNAPSLIILDSTGGENSPTHRTLQNVKVITRYFRRLFHQ